MYGATWKEGPHFRRSRCQDAIRCQMDIATAAIGVFKSVAVLWICWANRSSRIRNPAVAWKRRIAQSSWLSDSIVPLQYTGACQEWCYRSSDLNDSLNVSRASPNSEKKWAEWHKERSRTLSMQPPLVTWIRELLALQLNARKHWRIARSGRR